MDIEPIHELPADELQHALDVTRERIEVIYTHPKMYSKKTRERVNQQIEFNLNTLAYSIKKSLVFLFPKFDELINGIIDTNEASYAMSWASRRYPLHEGVMALQKIYGVLRDYQEPNDFKEMEQAIKEYTRIAIQYFHKHKMQEAAPLVTLGITRQKQLEAPRQKKNEALIKHCNELMLKKPSPSAAHLWSRFPEKGKPIFIDGTEIYRDETDGGEKKIFCISHTGKQITVGERAFANYFKNIKNSLNDNS